MARETYRCETCWGTESLSFDASCYWDVEAQAFVIDDIRESNWCDDCNSDSCADTIYIDDENEIIWESIDDVIEEADPLHMLARAKAAFVADSDTTKRDIDMLFDAVIEVGDLSVAIDFIVEYDQCKYERVRDLIIKQDDVEYMKQYMEKTANRDTLVMLNALLESVAKRRTPSMLEDIVKPRDFGPSYPYTRDLHLGSEQLDRVKTIYKLLGGKKYDFG